MANILVTGGAGFIGSNFILRAVKNHRVTNIDCLTYSANLENLKAIENHKNYQFKKIDICNAEQVFSLPTDFDYIVHFAAESHVDRSILGAEVFLKTNILGTYTLLEFARKMGNLKKFVHVSTDEVYGTLGDTGYFTEFTPIAPNSPYSASKASSDMVVRSYHETFHLPAVITRCSNNYGPYQFPEKLIPLMIMNALQDKPLPVYGKGTNVRDWIHVEDHCLGVELVMEKGKVGEVYNIGGESEMKNIDIVKKILHQLKKPESLIKYVQDRPGHDFRYAIDCSKIKKDLGFKHQYNFENGFEKTVKWYCDNRSWWERIINKDYLKYYEEQYGARI